MLTPLKCSSPTLPFLLQARLLVSPPARSEMEMCADLRKVLEGNVLPLLYREIFLSAYK